MSEHANELEVVIERAREAADRVPTDPYLLNNLALNLAARFQETGNPGDIDEAVGVGSRAAELGEATAEFPTILSNLAAFEATRLRACGGDPAGWGRIIELTKRALALTSPGSTEIGPRLSNLAAHLASRFAAGGRRSDLDDAIAESKKAWKATPVESQDRPRVLSNSAALLGMRWRIYRTWGDRDEAIGLARQSVDQAPGDPNCLTALADSLALSGDDRSSADLTEAVQVARQALDVVREPGVGRPVRLNNLAAHLWTRYKTEGDTADLREALQLSARALKGLPDGYPDRALLLNNLARYTWSLASVEGNELDAVAQISGVMAAWAAELNSGRVRRFDVTDAGPIWANRILRVAKYGPPPVRAVAATVGAAVLNGAERLCILPEAVEPDIRRRHAMELRRAVDGIGAVAAYAQLLSNGADPSPALGVLEGALTTVAVQQLGSPLWRHFEASTSDAAGRLGELTRCVAAAQAQGRDPEALWSEIRAAEAALNQAPGAVRIRRSPDELADAAKGVGIPFRWLASTTEGGFLIVLRPEGHRFHALIPALTDDRVDDWYRRLRPSAISPALLPPLRQPRGLDVVAPTRHAVEKVLEEVADTLGPFATWWGDEAWLVPVGRLASLPWQARWPRLRIHASGALHLIAHDHAQRAVPPQAAGMFDTLTHTDTDTLAHTVDEARHLQAHLGARIKSGLDVTRSELAQLGQLGVLHFALHGTDEPALVLADGNLYPDELGGFPHQFSWLRLLFINACFSASLGESNLDEAVGFATAATVAGTAATLAALWPVNDITAASFAGSFYAAYKNHGDPHRALREARETTPLFNDDDATLLAYQLLGH